MNEILPGWETVKVLGHGSFGTVYEIHRKLYDDEEEKAALKVISIPKHESDIEAMYSEGYDEESITLTFHSHLKNIMNEYMLMRKVSSANIVHCEDIRTIQHDDGIGWDIYIRMELLTPLTKRMADGMTEDAVIKLGLDICKALVMCQKYGVVHRDIKPQNIFVSENGEYKLGDFGIAKIMDESNRGTIAGTPGYMAPEVYNNQPYGSAADICSLGLVMYCLLNERRLPFAPLPPVKLNATTDTNARLRRLSGEPIPAPKNGSDELKRIVLKACAYNLEDRYSSASQMLAELRKLEPDFADIDVIVPTEPESDNSLITDLPEEDGTVALSGERRQKVLQEQTNEELEIPSEDADVSETDIPEYDGTVSIYGIAVGKDGADVQSASENTTDNIDSVTDETDSTAPETTDVEEPIGESTVENDKTAADIDTAAVSATEDEYTEPENIIDEQEMDTEDTETPVANSALLDVVPHEENQESVSDEGFEETEPDVSAEPEFDIAAENKPDIISETAMAEEDKTEGNEAYADEDDYTVTVVASVGAQEDNIQSETKNDDNNAQSDAESADVSSVDAVAAQQPKRKSKKKIVITICAVLAALPVVFVVFVVLIMLLLRGCDNTQENSNTESSRNEVIIIPGDQSYDDNSSDDWYEGPGEDSKAPDHVHSYSSEWIANAAVHWHQCDCGEMTDTAYHEYSQWVITTEATETTTGLQERSCSYCGYKETEVIPLLQHTHSYSSGWSSNSNSHWKVCSCGEKANVSSHAFGSWKTVTAASCTRNGKRVRTCTTCGYEESQTTAASSHSYKQGICSYCGKLQSEGLNIVIETVNGKQAAVVYGIGTCKDKDLYIPSKYKGVPVTTIGHSAFHKCTNLVSVTIPDSVTVIENGAFTGCTGLTRVVFTDTSKWYITQTEGASSGQFVDVSNAKQAASYVEMYRYYFWYKK